MRGDRLGRATDRSWARLARALRDRESGLSLTELLVVIVVIGALAAVGVPSLLNQKSKGSDVEAKSTAVTATQAMERCASDSDGTYATCSKEELMSIEPSLRDAADRLAISAGRYDYKVVVFSKRDSAVSFTLSRSSNGSTSRTCSSGTADRGGCLAPSTGTW